MPGGSLHQQQLRPDRGGRPRFVTLGSELWHVSPTGGQSVAAGSPGAVPADETLAALAKTLGRGLGLRAELLDCSIDGG